VNIQNLTTKIYEPVTKDGNLLGFAQEGDGAETWAIGIVKDEAGKLYVSRIPDIELK
jgi:hypothetical protein